MPYSNEQLMRFNQKPGDIAHFTTITISNNVAGTLRFLLAGPNGPYKDRQFSTNGVLHTYQVAYGTAPASVIQDPDSNALGNLTLARIGTGLEDYIRSISDGLQTNEDKVIRINLSTYDNVRPEPIQSYDLFCSKDGVKTDESTVTIPLEYENPAKVAYAYFYNPEVFEALLYA